MNKAQFGTLAQYYLDWIGQYQTKDCGNLNNCKECVLGEYTLECDFNMQLNDAKEMAKNIVKKYKVGI